MNYTLFSIIGTLWTSKQSTAWGIWTYHFILPAGRRTLEKVAQAYHDSRRIWCGRKCDFSKDIVLLFELISLLFEPILLRFFMFRYFTKRNFSKRDFATDGAPYPSAGPSKNKIDNNKSTLIMIKSPLYLCHQPTTNLSTTEKSSPGDL